jgi:hypothetical protein
MVLGADQMWVSEECQPGGRHNVLGTGVITFLEPHCPDLCVDDQLIAVESPGEILALSNLPNGSVPSIW